MLTRSKYLRRRHLRSLSNAAVLEVQIITDTFLVRLAAFKAFLLSSSRYGKIFTKRCRTRGRIIEKLWGEEPLQNRFRISPKGVDAHGKELDRTPIGFYYGRMGPKTYKYVIKRVCNEVGIEKPVTSASLGRTAVTLKVFAGSSDETVAKATKHKLHNRGNVPLYVDSYRSDLA